jgi:hypothetical protein
MPLSVSSSTISSSPESSAPDQPTSLGSEYNPGVAHGATESEPEHINPEESSSFLAGYSNDHAAASDPNNPSTEQLSQNEMEMRKAADNSGGRQPEALEDQGTKFAFMPSHFKEGVVREDNKESAKRLASMMPASLSEGGHLERLMLEPDPAHVGSHQVNENTLFESAAALKYAQQNGYDLSSVGRHSATVDFRATDQQGKHVLFDPFGSPQMKPASPALQNLRIGVQQLEDKQRKGELSLTEQQKLQKDQDSLKNAEEKFRKKPYGQTPDAWAKTTYTVHTNDTKDNGEGGAPVTGIFHTTATAADQMPLLHNAVQNRTNVTANTPNNVQEVDLNLAAEFTKEDHKARQEMLGRINKGSTRPQSDSSADQVAFKRKATDFLS